LRELMVYGVALGQEEGEVPVLLLKALEAPEFLPMRIGEGEALAIAMALQGKGSPRPLTHDLMASIVKALQATLVGVTITKVEAGIFYADLKFRRRDGEEILVDARPSDAVALALRLSAPLYIGDDLFQRFTQRIPRMS